MFQRILPECTCGEFDNYLIMHGNYVRFVFTEYYVKF